MLFRCQRFCNPVYMDFQNTEDRISKRENFQSFPLPGTFLKYLPLAVKCFLFLHLRNWEYPATSSAILRAIQLPYSSGLSSRPDFDLHPVSSDVARRLQQLRQRSVHPVSHWWETIQPAKTPSQELSVRGHPTEVPFRRRLYTGCTLSRSRRRFWLDGQPWKD